METELSEVRRYWYLQLNDPYFNAVGYVYRLSSTNSHFAKASSDGKFRAVISLQVYRTGSTRQAGHDLWPLV